MLAGIKIARVSTVAFFVDTQLSRQIKTIAESGAQVHVVASEPALNTDIGSARYRSIDIPRQIHVFKDLKALWQLWRFFRQHRFDIVHSTTPKAGLLCALAAKLAGVPIRLHTFTGQPWVTLGGLKRRLAIGADKLIVRLNTQCYTDSPSQTRFMEQQGIAPLNTLQTLNQGSLAGVDLSRFNPERFKEDERQALKRELGLTDDAVSLLFVGRISKDKGIVELVHAFEKLLKTHPECYLLLTGPLELNAEESGRLGFDQPDSESHIILTGYTPEPEAYMAISDLLCLPSYREGFGTVVIEAAAMGLPTVASRIYGLTDAVVDHETGLLVAAKQVEPLYLALKQLVEQPGLRQNMGTQAQARAQTLFDEKIMNQRLLDEYQKQLESTR
ncbi:MAG: glycosyltransferase [Thiomicrorhabdus chilensis]|uniref:glycosyltransferase n=1 Tax=Thiomicrorhabdus chilensis TaxID=63656 RepID=UPI00299F10F7|nr:glycosyltransferase [Thiomicrorhabdus chilensis]MDX1347436.1 glycosyltransferase [Thiomicrorhabdus chilensis]